MDDKILMESNGFIQCVIMMVVITIAKKEAVIELL